MGENSYKITHSGPCTPEDLCGSCRAWGITSASPVDNELPDPPVVLDVHELANGDVLLVDSNDVTHAVVEGSLRHPLARWIAAATKQAGNIVAAKPPSPVGSELPDTVLDNVYSLRDEVSRLTTELNTLALEAARDSNSVLLLQAENTRLTAELVELKRDYDIMAPIATQAEMREAALDRALEEKKLQILSLQSDNAYLRGYYEQSKGIARSARPEGSL